MQSNRIITLTTDFGVSSPYVAEMKGAILSIAPNARIVDATHSVEPQNVLHGAFCLRQFADVFPQGTIHVAVVDPGVGTDREILLVECHDQLFIAPNNGLLSLQLGSATAVRQIFNAYYWRDAVSSTFHGRDIMGPVAAHLSNGESVANVTCEFNGELEELVVPRPVQSSSNGSESDSLVGEIAFSDSFGNLITNISVDLGRHEILSVEFEGETIRVVKTYGEAPASAAPDTAMMSLVGSSGWLEIAIANGSAADFVPDSIGKSVRVRLRAKN